MAKAKKVKYQVIRSCRVGDEMIHREPDRAKPFKEVELDPDDAKGHAVKGGALKEVKKRGKK